MILKTSYKMKPPPSERTIKGNPQGRGNIGCWVINEKSGNKIFDCSGNQDRYLGDFVNVTWIQGVTGPALYFGGANNYVKLQQWDGGPIVSLVARVKFEQAIGADEQIATADSSGSALRIFQFRRSSTGRLQFIVFVGGAPITITGGTILATGLWWDVAAVNDGVQSHIYVNGVSDAVPVNTGNMDMGGADWSIGIRSQVVNWAGGLVEDLEGRVEFLYRYDRALNESEIKKLFVNPYCLFEHRMKPLFAVAAAPPEITALYMDLSTQIWTIKHSKGLFTKL